MSSQDESSRKAKPERKNHMSQKKVKKTIQVRDLMPLKDARGGRHHRHRHTSVLLDKEPHIPGGGYGIHQPQ